VVSGGQRVPCGKAVDVRAHESIIRFIKRPRSNIHRDDRPVRVTVLDSMSVRIRGPDAGVGTVEDDIEAHVACNCDIDHAPQSRTD